MPSAVLVTPQIWDSRRKAGFHWIADALLKLQWDVLFLTVGLSNISRLRRDYRVPHVHVGERNHLLRRSKQLETFALWTRWHSGSFRNDWLDKASTSLFERYGRHCPPQLAQRITDADTLIFDSGHPLQFVANFRDLNPDARLMYRMSDIVTILNIHPVIEKVERQVLHAFDLVSMPSTFQHKKFDHISTSRLQPHGVNTDAFDHAEDNPFPEDHRKNAVFVGTFGLDRDFMVRGADLRPDTRFHVIGPKLLSTRSTDRENIIVYGELDFERTVPYIRHADFGLHPVSYTTGAESFSDSPKVMQYSYCRRPILAPEFLHSARPNVVPYRPGSSQGIGAATAKAESCEPTEAWSAGIRSWDWLATALVTG